LTYGSADYARIIVNNLILTPDKPHRNLEFVFSNEYHEMSHRELNLHGRIRYPGDKNLNFLFDRIQPPNFFRYNTLLIDDTDSVIQNNPRNSIQVPKFWAYKNGYVLNEALQDQTLLKLQQLLQNLNPNVECFSINFTR
jgi:hypothetical protein